MVLIVAVGGGFLLWPRHPVPEPRIGMVRDTQVRLAPEISGRLATIGVQPGSRVAKGDVIAELDVPELVAQLGEARAAAASAAADRDRIFAGARPEEIAAAAEAVSAAEAQLTLAKQVQARISALATNDVESRSRLDDADATVAKASADLALRQAELAVAQVGPTAEERNLADRQVALAEAKAAELEARLAKARILAPADGTIGTLIAEPGEIIAPGTPVATLLPDGSGWFAFTVREDHATDIAVGAELTVTPVAGEPIAARVVELRPLGDFATWRAARAVGDHDLNSLRVRLDPLAPEPLEAGRTVFLPPPDAAGSAAGPT